MGPTGPSGGTTWVDGSWGRSSSLVSSPGPGEARSKPTVTVAPRTGRAKAESSPVPSNASGTRMKSASVSPPLDRAGGDFEAPPPATAIANIRAWSDSPRSSSIAYQGRPSDWPVSMIRTRPGCLIRARAWISRRIRWSIPRLRTRTVLTATSSRVDSWTAW